MLKAPFLGFTDRTCRKLGGGFILYVWCTPGFSGTGVPGALLGRMLLWAKGEQGGAQDLNKNSDKAKDDPGGSRKPRWKLWWQAGRAVSRPSEVSQQEAAVAQAATEPASLHEPFD